MRRFGTSSRSTIIFSPRRNSRSLTDDCHTKKLRAAVEAILAGYNEGTRFGIRADRDGLLSAGEHGQQLTWMDARVDGREITPRIGKPVEIQALWLNALAIGAKFSARWQSLFEKGRAAFERKFWNEHAGYLADVIDCDHQPGDCRSYISAQPNLRSWRVATHTVVEQRKRVGLLMRSKCFCSRRSVCARSLRASRVMRRTTRATPRERDAVYHQGTVWPWLIGPFVEAWVRVHGPRAARKKKRAPNFFHRSTASESGWTRSRLRNLRRRTAAHATRLSVPGVVLGELLRLERSVLA